SAVQDVVALTSPEDVASVVADHVVGAVAGDDGYDVAADVVALGGRARAGAAVQGQREVLAAALVGDAVAAAAADVGVAAVGRVRLGAEAARHALQRVVGGAATERVAAFVAHQIVGADAAVDHVVAALAIDRVVVAVAGIDRAGAVPVPVGVVAVAEIDGQRGR